MYQKLFNSKGRNLLVLVLGSLLLVGCAANQNNSPPVIAASKPEVIVSDEMKQLYEAALQAMNQDRLGQADSYLQQIIDLEPNISAPYVTRGRIAEMLGDRESAQQLYQHALVVDASNHRAMNQLAMMARERGEFTEAKKMYERAISIKPDESLYHKNYAILLDMYMGDLESALEHYELYQELHKLPDNRVALWVVDLKRRIQ
ncbi:tetratricopeptide repeat protein [Hahella ganghwensis]|uniref:tetratricopeptide repeat protein n=1 Tax=Hahella ganghwensis TaxID=286420 RepID=UPI00037E2AF3|nr:tetratricopeptide repeat protein [Hahella ganghwensis]